MDALIKAKFPQAYANWDQWNYRIFGPISFDDEPKVIIWLINENGLRQILELEVK